MATQSEKYATYLKADPENPGKFIFSIDILVDGNVVAMGGIEKVAKSLGWENEEKSGNAALFMINWVKLRAREGFLLYASEEGEKRRLEVLEQLEQVM